MTKNNDRQSRTAITDQLAEGRELMGKTHRRAFDESLRDLLVEYKRKRNFCAWTRDRFPDLQ